MIPVVCTACHKKLAAKDTLAGKKIKCPGCGQLIAVAAPAPVAAPAGGIEETTLIRAPGPTGLAPTTADNRQTHAGASMFEDTRNSAGEGGADASLTDFLAPSQAGDELGRLGKYRILQVLGHGGMGVVYKAEDPVLKRTVAVKAMLPGMAASASAGKRFLREAQTMAAVKHDHIVVEGRAGRHVLRDRRHDPERVRQERVFLAVSWILSIPRPPRQPERPC